VYKIKVLRLNFLDEIQTKEFSSLLFTVTSTALPRDFHFFQLTQPLTVQEQEGKPDSKPYPFPYGLGNPYRTLKSETSQDYAQKPQQNCTLMNSASALPVVHTRTYSIAGLIPKFNIPVLDLASFNGFSLSLSRRQI
jgi:hypothetical protein